MSNREADEELTSQDHGNFEWQPRDVVLMVIAFLILFGVLIVCSGLLKG
jgi:hypothetical protein